MNYSIIRYMLGWVTFIAGILMVFPTIVAGIYGEKTGFVYLICASLCIAIGRFLSFRKPSQKAFFAREGFIVVAISWIVLSLVGSMPFYLSGEFNSFTDALFEIISGFTTTGTSVIADVESLSHSTLFWRSFSHWIGGMGVLVFILALLPMTGGQSMYFMKAESPGPSVGKLVPRLQKTAKYLYTIYLFLTSVMVIFLLIGKMSLFDALCTAFATAGTGGFANYANSMGDFSIYIQNVVTIFMMLFGINFNFFFLVAIRKLRGAFSIEEVRWYLGIYAGAVIAIAINITTISGNFFHNLQIAAFQSASIMTTTGFSTVNFNLWPSFSKAILVCLMFIGACSGSTGGGIKVSRILIYLKTVRKELRHLIHPKAVKVLKLDKKPIDHDVVRSVNIFLIAYVGIFTFSVLILSLENLDAVTTITAVATTLNNIGPGLGAAGPIENFGFFSNLSKYVMMFDMLAGRLEIFPLLLLFTPAAWRKK